jgi:anti-anti-sigma factor
MSVTQQDLLQDWNPSAAASSVDLDMVNAQQVARSLARDAQQSRPQLIVDCSRLKCLRTLGVSHVISELLVLHKAGADIWLRNVDPALHRCLSLLKLTRLFRTSLKLA